MKISIIGTGIYGIALALDMVSNGHSVITWTESDKLYKRYVEKHNFKPITNAIIPDEVKVTTDIKEALENTDFIVLATSAKYVRSICKDMKNIITLLLLYV